MNQEIIVEAKGLYTNPNYLSAPPGALSGADDVVISRPGVLEPRRGYTYLDTSGVNGESYSHLYYWDKEPTGRMLAIQLGGPSGSVYGWVSGTNAEPQPGGSTFHPIEQIAFTPQPRFYNTNSDLYFTTLSGVFRHAGDPSGTMPMVAGVFPGFIALVSASAPGTGSAITDDCQVAYRVVWWHKDESGNLHEGPPSGRQTFVNQGVQIQPGGMQVTGGLAAVTPQGGHPFAVGQLVTINSNAFIEPNVPLGDYQVLTTTGSVTFTINLNNSLQFSNLNVIRIGNAARNGQVRVQVPRGIPAYGSNMAASASQAGYYYQIYRAPASLTSDVDASDECGLVWESNVITQLSGCHLRRLFGVQPTVYVYTYNNVSSSFQIGDYVEMPASINPGGGSAAFLSGAYRVTSIAPNAGGAAFTYDDGTGFNGAQADVSSALNPWTYTVIDTITDGLAGAALYTNPNQQGILFENDAPPAATDIALFKNSLFYADTTSRYRAQVQLNTCTASIASPNPDDGVFDGMTLYITGSTDGIATWNLKYRPIMPTDPLAQNPNSGYYGVFAPQIYTTLSPAACIAATAQSLVGTINNDYRNQNIRAYYVSNADDVPGKIALESINISPDITQHTFNLSMGLRNGTPSSLLPSTVTASVDDYPNGLAYSKSQEFEGCPLAANSFRIGDNDKPILRIVPLQNALVVVKEEGLFRVVGDGAENFRVEVLDNTVRCIAPESCAAMNNRVYMLTQYGVAEVTEQGVQVISTPIDDQIKELLSTVGRSTVFSSTFAIADSEDRKYKLWVPSTTGITYADKVYVYDFYTTTWTRWRMAANHGTVHVGEHRVWRAGGPAGGLYAERKQGNWTDFSDYSASATSTLTLVPGTTSSYTLQTPIYAPAGYGVVSGNMAGAVGNVYAQNAYVISSSYSISTPTVVTLSKALTTGTNVFAVIPPVPSELIWVPKVGGNVAGVNQYREVGFAYRQGSIDDNTTVVTITGDILPQNSGAVTIYGSSKYGLQGPDVGNPPFRVRVGIPRNAERSSELTVKLNQSLCHNWFQVQNMSLTLNQVSEKQGKR